MLALPATMGTGALLELEAVNTTGICPEDCRPGKLQEARREGPALFVKYPPPWRGDGGGGDLSCRPGVLLIDGVAGDEWSGVWVSGGATGAPTR